MPPAARSTVSWSERPAGVDRPHRGARHAWRHDRAGSPGHRRLAPVRRIDVKVLVGGGWWSTS